MSRPLFATHIDPGNIPSNMETIMKFAVIAAPVLLAAGLAVSPALADDRKPTPEELARIEAVLKAEGFTSWGEIELDDNRVWEVDDARHADGKEYDLDLDPQSLAIIKRDPD